MHTKAFARATALCALTILSACGPSDKQRAELAEKKRIECLDKICAEDVAPKHDTSKEVALKLNGQWFIGPKYYFSSGMNGASFYWPSKKNREDVPPKEREEPYAHTVEILLRSSDIPPEPRGYAALVQRQAEGRVFDRKTIRKGLDSMRTRRTDGTVSRGIIYVATEQRGFDGLPPVLGCDDSQLTDRCSTGYLWQDGVYAGIRMNQKHGADWPEIFQETTRVLQLLKKV